MATKIKTEEFDRIFDEGKEDITQYLDMSTIHRPNLETKAVNVLFPVWMIEELDKEAEKLAVNRQAIIKTWLADRIKAERTVGQY